MSAELVFDNITNKLHLPISILPKDGQPYDHHFKGSTLDNLVELCGRVCYDSCNSKNTRNSKDYHKHINDVNHGSVQEHCNLTFHIRNPKKNHERDSTYDNRQRWEVEALYILANRPGVWFKDDSYEGFFVTANLRAILEWRKDRNDYLGIGKDLQIVASEYAPLVFGDLVPVIDGLKPKPKLDIKVIKPEQDEEIWASFYISGVSRGLSHELVRHKYRTAVSQRSTRYVDESESDWSWHPLITKYSSLWEHDIWSNGQPAGEECENHCKWAYRLFVEKLEKELIFNGVDKITARKQARGAARGVLGNALSTELIFSASLAQWKRMLLQRMSDAADAEIRVLFNEIFVVLKEKFPEDFQDCKVGVASDGIGLAFTEAKL